MLHDGRREKKSTQYNDASKNSARHATTAAVSAFLGYLLRFSIFASSIPRLKTHARSVHTSCVETHALFLPFIATQQHGSSPGSTHPPSPARQRHSKVTLKGQFKGRSWMSHGEGLFLGAPRARSAPTRGARRFCRVLAFGFRFSPFRFPSLGSTLDIGPTQWPWPWPRLAGMVSWWPVHVSCVVPRRERLVLVLIFH